MKIIKKTKLMVMFIAVLLFSFIPNQVSLSEKISKNTLINTLSASSSILEDPTSLSYALLHPLVTAGYYWAFLKKIYPTQSWDFGVNKPFVEVGYNESVTVQLGMMDLTNLNNSTFRVISLQEFLQAKSFTFKVVGYPNSFDDSWTIVFDPPIIELDRNIKKVKCVTNVTITLTAPPVADHAIQSGVLKIKVAAVQAFNDFWNMSPAVWMWNLMFHSALGMVNQPSLDKMREIDILVKVKPYHSVSFKAPKNIELNPNEVKAVPITLKNLGNYKDTFVFKVEEENAERTIKLTDPIDITLRPGEEKNTLLGIGVPPDVWDPGTLHVIKIQAFSITQPNVTLAEQTLVVKTKGLYVSEENLLVFLPLVMLLVFLIIGMFVVGRKKELFRFLKKERKHEQVKKILKKLKQKDVFNKAGKSFERFFKKIFEAQKEEAEKPVRKKLLEELKIKKPVLRKVEKKDPMEEMKERVVRRVKKEEKKQLKKIGR